MPDMEDWLFAGFLGVCAAATIGLIIGGINSLDEQTAFKQRCETAGGAVLQNSERVGKITHSAYVCVDPKMLKDVH